MKYFLRFLLIILIAISGYLIYINYFASGKIIDSMNLVPEDAIYIVETKQPIKAWENFSKSDLWRHMKTYPSFAEINANADALDDLIKQNKAVFSIFGFNHLLISAHITQARDYDFLFIIDMSSASQSNILVNNLDKIFALGDFDVTQLKYSNININVCKNRSDKSVLYAAVVGNYFVCSYTKNLVEKSINQHSMPKLAVDQHFVTVKDQMSTSGLAQVYLNFKAMVPFLKLYMGEMESGTQDMLNNMHFAAMDAELEDKYLKLDGYLQIDDSVPQLLTALLKGGKSAVNVQEILSERTAFMMRMGFDNFDLFYSNMFELSYPKGDKKLDRKIRLMEILLGFSMKEDLMGWMGDEICISQNVNEKMFGNKVPKILSIKAKDISQAKEKMGKIGKKVRRRTPLKFNTYQFRDYEINYLETKGLFQLLFGKLFDKIEKPFYTYIGNYVVFCDDARTLLQMIIDYEDGKTIAKDASFDNIFKDFKKASTVMVYLSPKLYFNNFKSILAPSKYLEMSKNKQYITCFNGSALQMIASENGVFETQIGSNFFKEQIVIVPDSMLEEEQLQKLDEIDKFIITKLNDNAVKKLYENGVIESITEVDAMQIPNGVFTAYWENGNVKIKGKYRDGIAIGAWKYYSDEGKLTEKIKN